MIPLQIPLLLSIGEEDTALTKATESGDPDLVYLVLFHIWLKVLLSNYHSKVFVFLVDQGNTWGIMMWNIFKDWFFRLG